MKRLLKSGLFYIILFGMCFIGGRASAQLRTSTIMDTMAQPQLEQPQSTQPQSTQPQSAKLAILIDDFGYHGEGTEEMLALPIDLTVAILPFSEKALAEVEMVAQSGKEMVIHMPMESLTGKKEWVGEKGVFLGMKSEEIQALVEEAFAIVPQAVGLNNHMGSAIMEDSEALRSVMGVLAEKDKFFVDSVTTANSVGEAVSKEYQVPFLKRSVFLDSTDDIAVVKKNLLASAEIAKNEGTAIAIGHVGPEGGMVTVQAIAELIPEIEAMGVTFVFVSELLS